MISGLVLGLVRFWLAGRVEKGLGGVFYYYVVRQKNVAGEIRYSVEIYWGEN